jgi:hypothetical protein
MADTTNPRDGTAAAMRDAGSDESAGSSSSSATTSTAGAPLDVADAAAHILAAAAGAPVAVVAAPPADSPTHVDTSCWEWLRGAPPAELPPALATERDALLAAAARGYDASDPAHVRLMHTLFQKLTGAPFAGGPAAAPAGGAGGAGEADDNSATAADAARTPPCSSSSSWEAIGFQRPDAFDSDLRGVGLLGPLAALYLAQTYPAVSASRSSSRLDEDVGARQACRCNHGLQRVGCSNSLWRVDVSVISLPSAMPLPTIHVPIAQLAAHLFELAGGGGSISNDSAATAAVSAAVPPAAAPTGGAAASPPVSSVPLPALEWPFMVVSLNVTLHALGALKAGRLHRACAAAAEAGERTALARKAGSGGGSAAKGQPAAAGARVGGGRLLGPVAVTLLDLHCALFAAFGKAWARQRRRLKAGDVPATHVGRVLQQLTAQKGTRLTNVDRTLAKFRARMAAPPWAAAAGARGSSARGGGGGGASEWR